ncbi:MAG TPA: class I SAM-dependent RNA methyltransferase [Candidatus Hydrogenedentes bacterium]|nr:class I SAM-dependent RNA methyltransferase [Candidatus Hydrogenedentota bacterium]
MTDSNVLCRHFGECGGCLNQDVPYEQQLALKQAALQKLFREFWHAPIPITPSPVVWHYRNKVDPSFALQWYPEPPPAGFERDTVLGFKQKGKWFRPLEIEECRIGPAGLDALLQGVREWRQQCGLRACGPRKRQGYLRNLLVRDGKRSGERMVALITMPGPFEHSDSFVAMVNRCFNAASIYHGEFAGRADVATADKLTLLYGRNSIQEILEVPESDNITSDPSDPSDPSGPSDEPHSRSLIFRISPLSFFQTNPLAAERLYGHIRAWAAQRTPDVLFDLYGGSGGVALSCADCASEIISVENVAAATEDGCANASTNNVDNVFFVTDSMRNYLRNKIESGGFPEGSAVVVDPPRAGMHPKAVRRLIQLYPQHVLYVSCNPKRLREELPAFLEAYHLVELQAVDMFPHTPHVEALAVFERR